MKKTLVLIVGLAATLAVGAAESPEPLKVLSIGNSFSGNAHTYLRKITAEMGDKLILGHASIGSCSLAKHWNNAVTNGASYRYSTKFKAEKITLEQYLKAEQWDIVTIQQVSGQSRTPSTFEPYGSNLISFIRQHAPQAEIVVHQIWAYRRPTLEAMTTMHEKTRQTYHEFAGRYGLRVLPSGDAIQLARAQDGWCVGYRPPDKKTGAPAEGKTLNDDGNHTGPNGSYLLGCLWYEYLFKKDVRPLKYRPDKVSEEDAAKLRAIAHQTLAK